MKKPKTWTRFAGGISDFVREGLIPDTFASGIAVDVRSEPQNATILPRTIKESGSVVTDLIKWADAIPTTLDLYLYGNAGNIYKRTSAGSYSFMHQAAGSHGNGLAYSAEDDFVYYTSDKTIGRYGPVASPSPQFVDDFFGSQGGVPLNTFSLQLTATSSQYASHPDSASLSIVSDLSLSAQIKPATLPTVGNSATLISKWDESGATRSYRFDISAVSGVFGNGNDGAKTISVDTTDAPIDSACIGSLGSALLSATNVSFAAGQQVLIHQTGDSGAGTYMRNSIAGYSAGSITLSTPLNADYAGRAQVLVLSQYTDVTVNAGVTWTAKAWNGVVGGILGFLANGTTTIAGTITASAKGYRGASAAPNTAGQYNYIGEGTTQGNAATQSATGAGGGGGSPLAVAGGGGNYYGGGGGGSHATVGTNGTANSNLGGTTPGLGATQILGTDDLTTMVFGGGAGSTGEANGASGGGIVYLVSNNITITGLVTSNGGNGTSGTTVFSGGTGGGAGGSILLRTQVGSIGTSLISATGGTGGTGGPNNSGVGGNGGMGRIHVDYLTSLTGTTTSPNLSFLQDNTLVTTTTYQLRLAISDDGTNFDLLTKNVVIQTAAWQQVAVSWASTTKTATFFLNAVVQGTAIGTKTSISDNGSDFAVGAYSNSSGVKTAFYDGLIDEVRIWSVQRGASDLIGSINRQISGSSAGLQAYYQFNNDYTDTTSNGNLLAATNSPTFSPDVPFSSATTRADIDRSASTSGFTYTVPLALAEDAADKLVFTPLQDPQKSVAVNIATIGTGDWTLVVHDQYNNVVASKTVLHANLNTGLFEFVFATPWRPLTTFTNNYHFHLTSTVADGTVVTGSASNLSTVTYQTFFQFLVNDVDYHPVARFLNFVVFGNERHIGKYDATLYDPNFISLPAGWRIRCFAYWGEYLAIGVWKGNTITDFDQGRVYFWDGVQPTFNFYIDIPQGGVNALFGAEGNLYIWAGYQGYMLQYTGGMAATPIKRIPRVVENPDNRYVEVAPGAVTMWKKLLRFGVCFNSDSPDIVRAGYTWGRNNIYYPEILTCDYPISTGNHGSSVKIGMMTSIGKKLLMAWQDNVAFGVDYVDSSNPCYPSARIEFLINDDDMIWKQKQAVSVVVNTDPIITGQSITQQYQIDSSGTWKTNSDPIKVGSLVSRQSVPNGRYNQIQVAVDLATTINTGPVINGVTLELEDQETSGRVG